MQVEDKVFMNFLESSSMTSFEFMRISTFFSCVRAFMVETLNWVMRHRQQNVWKSKKINYIHFTSCMNCLNTKTRFRSQSYHVRVWGYVFFPISTLLYVPFPFHAQENENINLLKASLWYYFKFIFSSLPVHIFTFYSIHNIFYLLPLFPSFTNKNAK